MAAIEEHIQVVVEGYDYENPSAGRWIPVATLGDADVISASSKKQCCADGAYEIGGVYAATLSIVCKVSGMTYFQMKSCRLKVKHQYGSGDFTNIGVFYVSDVQKTGELFSISGQDVIGFTDISSSCAGEWSCSGSVYAECKAGEKSIEGVVESVLGIAGRYVEAKTGINYPFKFKAYDTDANGGWKYANACVADWDYASGKRISPSYDYPVYYPYEILNAQDPAVHDKVKPVPFGLYADEDNTDKFYGNARSDKPRDFLRYAAAVAAGFIYADYGDAAGQTDTDFVTLGQFGEPRWGYNNGTTDTTVEITTDEIELDSCEIADFTIQYIQSTLSAELKHFSRWNWRSEPSPDYQTHAYIRLHLTDNPFVDYYLDNWCLDTEREYNKVALFGLLNSGIWEPVKTYAGGYSIRPFHATIHKPVDFHLGQRIRFRDYKGCGETVAHTYDSILTSIQWTFRGGYKLACGGEDERTMGDAIRASKGDKVRRQLRDDLDALHAIYL